MVGPLPASNVTKLQSLTYPFNSDNPGKTRIPPLTLPGQNIAGFIEKFGIEIEDISLALWNTVGLRSCKLGSC
jgi:primary-amine oxidase